MSEHSKYPEIAWKLAQRLIECGVPEPKNLPPHTIQELQEAVSRTRQGALLKIEHVAQRWHGTIYQKFLRVETTLGLHRNLFYIKL